MGIKVNNCLGCQRLENPDQCVTLVSGDVVCTYCPARLTECEARELLKLPKQARIEALKKRELKRGNVDELKKAMTDIFNQRKEME